MPKNSGWKGIMNVGGVIFGLIYVAANDSCTKKWLAARPRWELWVNIYLAGYIVYHKV